MDIYTLNYAAVILGILSGAMLIAEAVLWVTDPDRRLPKSRRQYEDGGHKK